MLCDRGNRIVLLALALAMEGCGNLVVREEQDSGPARPVDVAHIAEPVPREEPRTAAGNKTPYRVLGKTYHLMPNPEGYRERGIASWYGNKFHGRKTANGELYNMYGMTAAHKTLPIPSYVRVTNTVNRASVIVRVNDRGPFHGDRLIDLTYAAAKKLGFEKQGTAQVLVEYIDPATHRQQAGDARQVSAGVVLPPVERREPRAPAPVNSAGYALPANTFLQVGAFSKEASARALKLEIAKLTQTAVVVVPPKKRQSLFRVQVGPFIDNLELLLFRKKLLEANYPSPHVVYQ